MHCFAHHGVAAVAVCPSCGKALCHACTLAEAEWQVCGEACLARISSLHQGVALAERKTHASLSVTVTFLLGSAVVLFAVSAFFVLLAALNALARNWERVGDLIVIVLFCAGSGVVFLLSARRFRAALHAGRKEASTLPRGHHPAAG